MISTLPSAPPTARRWRRTWSLDQIAIGPIVMRNVPALVARPGALDESLLGMSFLERLKSYAVERDRLVLVAKVTAR